MNPKEEQFIQTSHLYPQKDSVIEDIVKKHLDIIILTQINNNSLCGKHIAREIFNVYQTFVNPSAIYTILNSLKEEGILSVYTLKGDLRTKYYTPTKQGKQIIKDRINDFNYSMEYVIKRINYIESEGIKK